MKELLITVVNTNDEVYDRIEVLVSYLNDTYPNRHFENGGYDLESDTFSVIRNDGKIITKSLNTLFEVVERA